MKLTGILGTALTGIAIAMSQAGCTRSDFKVSGDIPREDRMVVLTWDFKDNETKDRAMKILNDNGIEVGFVNPATDYFPDSPPNRYFIEYYYDSSDKETPRRVKKLLSEVRNSVIVNENTEKSDNVFEVVFDFKEGVTKEQIIKAMRECGYENVEVEDLGLTEHRYLYRPYKITVTLPEGSNIKGHNLDESPLEPLLIKHSKE